jgi:Glyoxalase-like domain
VKGRSSERLGSHTILAQVDHLVYATPDLEAAVGQLEMILGVQAAPGGRHLAWGTRNALISLGEKAYLEIVGPDPEQPEPDWPRPFGIDKLDAPQLVTWAVKRTNLRQVVDEAKRRGVNLGDVLSGSRRRPDGVLLSWELTDPFQSLANGIIPFFIDWGETPHPAGCSTQGCSLFDLCGQHPDAEQVQVMLGSLGLCLRVVKDPVPTLVAFINTPGGMVELR